MITLRAALLDDLTAIEALIARSARELSVGYYTPSQVAALLRYVFGADTQLVRDGTYFLCEVDGVGAVAAGGWSRRATLFGADRLKSGDDPLLDPGSEPARLRAFFVDPAWARRGLGRRLYDQCVTAARDAGFRRLTLVATLPGEPLYRALGFTADERFALRLPDGTDAAMVRMSRSIDA